MSKQQQPKVVILREHDAEPTGVKSEDVVIRIVPKKEREEHGNASYMESHVDSDGTRQMPPKSGGV